MNHQISNVCNELKDAISYFIPILVCRDNMCKMASKSIMFKICIVELKIVNIVQKCIDNS